MPVQSSAEQMRNTTTCCLLFPLLTAVPGLESPLTATGLVGSCWQSVATSSLGQTRSKNSTQDTKKSLQACRNCWLISRARGEINQRKYSFKLIVLSVPCCAGKSSSVPLFSSSPILNRLRSTFPVQLMKLSSACSSLSMCLMMLCHNSEGNHYLPMAVAIHAISEQEIELCLIWIPIAHLL